MKKKMLAVSAMAVSGLFLANGCSENSSGEENVQGATLEEFYSSSSVFALSSSEGELYSSTSLLPWSSSESEILCSSSSLLMGSSSASEMVSSSSAVEAVGCSSSFAVSSSSAELVLSSSAAVMENAETFVESYADQCPEVKAPTVNNTKLPDPFTKVDGSKVTTLADWKCRREEISSLFQQTEFGVKPAPPEKVTGSYSNGTLTVNVTDNGKTVSFQVSISGNGTKENPVPAMIGFGGGSLGSAYSGMGVATINFNPDAVAPEASRGSGKFYDLYGSSHSAGALIAWAWGISRVIDALAVTPEAGVDVHHLGVTGCSRWGKGALVAGAFDERFALVIPQESGSGGASNWRSVLKDGDAQPLSSACTEAAWFKNGFCNYQGNTTYTLPTDHHMLTGMVAPRGLLVLDNQGWVWLGENPSYHNAMTTEEIYVALGAKDAFTFSKQGGHNHCTLPESQYDEVKDFVNKYLLEKPATTGKIDKGNYSVSFTKSDWVDWETPTLK